MYSMATRDFKLVSITYLDCINLISNFGKDLIIFFELQIGV